MLVRILDCRGLTFVLLSKGGSKKLVHIIRVRPLVTGDSEDQGVMTGWSSPLFHHENDPSTITDVQSDDSSISIMMVPYQAAVYFLKLLHPQQ